MFNKLSNFIQDEIIDKENCSLNADTNLLEYGLDSIKIMKLIIFIEEEYNINFPGDKINPKSLSTIQKITKIILNTMNRE